ARIRLRARSSALRAYSEYGSSSTSPSIISHLQAPQLPDWQLCGNETPACSAFVKIVSPVIAAIVCGGSVKMRMLAVTGSPRGCLGSIALQPNRKIGGHQTI